jgi:type II secretory pathway component PulM
MSGGFAALRERLLRVDRRTVRWLLAAVVIFALFFELTARHDALERELPRLRVAAGEAADLGAAIRAAQAAQAPALAPAAFATALDALSVRQELALRSTAEGAVVTTRGQATPEALTRWLEAAQRELRRPVASARLETAGAAGAPLLNVTVTWVAGEGR